MDDFVKCVRCGWKNPKNEVFCANCHRILGEMDSTRQRIKKQHARAILKVLVVVLILPPFVMAGCALWPRTATIGTMGSERTAKRTAQILSSMHNMDGHVLETGRDVSEREVNAYFEHLRVEKLSFDHLYMDFGPGRLHMRATRTLGPWSLFGIKIAPTVSRDFTVAVEDGAVVVEKAALGHLPLVWAFRPGSFARFMRGIRDEPELKLLARAKSVTLHEDRIHITFGGEQEN